MEGESEMMILRGESQHLSRWKPWPEARDTCQGAAKRKTRGEAPNTVKSELARRAPLEVSSGQIRMAVVEMKHED